MRIEEARYLGGLVRELTTESKVTVLNLGSSTGCFRKTEQRHIHGEIFFPLEREGCLVVHSDLKAQEGVDIAGDIFEAGIQKQLKAIRPGIVLACNLMEHLSLESRHELPKVIDSILVERGVVIITVPYSYPLHLDPIDTYYRPSPKELSLLFPSYEVLGEEVIVSTSFWGELRSLGFFEILKIGARVLFPFYHFKVWCCLLHRFFWLFRPYKVSCVALRKVSMEGLKKHVQLNR